MTKSLHTSFLCRGCCGALIILAFLSSCNTIKYLKNDEVLLKKNEINISDDYTDTRQAVLSNELFPVIRQKPNEKIFGLFRTPLWYFYNVQGEEDTTVFDNWIRNNVAEPPSLIDSSRIENERKNLQHFLVNKGYRNAQVNYTVQTRNKKGIVSYQVEPGKKWIMDSVWIRAIDPVVDSIMQHYLEDSYLKAGNPFDESSFSLEKSRITNLLQNLGYFQFVPNYILAQADTTKDQLAVRLIISNPSQDSVHQKFYIGNIDVFSDISDLLSGQTVTQIDEINNIRFYSNEPEFYIDPEVITSNIALQQDSLYQKENLVTTRNKLNRLDIIKLVTIRSNLRNDTVDFAVYLPRNKKIVQETNLDINYSTFTRRIGRSLFGLSGSTNFRNKNLFGRGETLLTNIEVGADINLSMIDSFGFFNSFSARVQNDLAFPRFIDVLGLFHLLNRVRIGNGLISDRFLYNLENEGITKVSLIYDYLSLTTFYNRHSLTLGLNYELFSNPRKRFRIGQMGINLWVPSSIKPSFDSFLDNNLYFKNSFGERLFTGFIFNNFIYDYRSIPTGLGDYWRVNTSVEFSGHELALVNLLVNGNRDTLRLNDEIEFSNYGRLEVDVRRHIQISPNQSLVFRLNTGVAFPYATTSSVPYVKQFFVGGPFSIRAWRVRELGPGGHIDTLVNGAPNLLFFYQTGDFKLEANLEYRFPMFWRFEGALFIDAGNVWSLRKKEQDDRANAKLSGDFLKQIAIGSGFGLRTDFQYFILRLDIGTKVRNPYRHPELGTYYPYRNFSQAMALNNLNFNIALDYPF